MKRRTLLVGGLVAAGAAGLALVKRSMSDQISIGTPPWHLWGTSSENLGLDSAVLGTPGTTTQLARIAYKRPETWEFAFQLVITSMTLPNNDWVLDVFFDLTFGVGRSKISIDGFEHYNVTNTGGAGFTPPRTLWSTEVVSPFRNQSIQAPGASTSPGVCNHIVAQDIQCKARAIFLGSPGNHVNLEVSALFAPRVHVRPEWYQGVFDGGELRGH